MATPIHEVSWSNDKHRAQWRATLKRYVYPVIGALPIREINTPLVLKIVEPIWKVKPETASRVRGQIETILDWAKRADTGAVKTLRSGVAIWTSFYLESRKCVGCAITAPSLIKTLVS